MRYSQLRWYLLAGMCGGMAEVLWIGMYSFFSGASLITIGAAISATFWPSSANLVFAPILGLVIHLGLSLLLALVLGNVLQRMFAPRQSQIGIVVVAIAMLALVWKINFYLVLPIWNPGFIGLLPLSVTFVSKLLFGVSMGLILALAPARPSAA